MWGNIVSLIGFIVWYFGLVLQKNQQSAHQELPQQSEIALTKEEQEFINNTQAKKERLSRIIKKVLHVVFWAACIGLLVGIIADSHKNTILAQTTEDNATANKKSAKTIDSLKVIDSTSQIKIDSLRNELSIAKKEITDTVKICSQNNINQTKLTEQNISDAVAKGVEKGIYVANENKRAIDKEFDSVKNIPDLSINANVDDNFDKDTSKWIVNMVLKNGGRGRAYNVKFIVQSLYSFKKEYVKYTTYCLLDKIDLFNGRNVDIPIGEPNYSQTPILKNKMLEYDNVFLIAMVSYNSESGKLYNISNIIIFDPFQSPHITFYNGGVKDMDNFIRANFPDIKFKN